MYEGINSRTAWGSSDGSSIAQRTVGTLVRGQGKAAAHQAEVLVVAAHLQAVVVVLGGVVQAVVGARAGDDDVRGPPAPEAVEQLAVIVLQSSLRLRA